MNCPSFLIALCLHKNWGFGRFIFFEMRLLLSFSGILATLSAILLSSLLSPVLSDEILGCGGFVKLSPSLKGLVGTSKAAKKKN